MMWSDFYDALDEWDARYSAPLDVGTVKYLAAIMGIPRYGAIA